MGMEKGSGLNFAAGGSGGGSAKFPTIVTDSGSSLPATTEFSYNDTFINTTDKKLYTFNSPDRYAMNTDSFASLGTQGTFDDTTGTFSGFSTGETYLTPTNTVSFTLVIPFQVGSLGSTMSLVQFNYQGPNNLFNVRIASNGDVEVKTSGSSYSTAYSSLTANGKYILRVEVTGTEGSNDRSVKTRVYDENNNALGEEVSSSYSSASIGMSFGVLKNFGPNSQIFNGTIFGFMGEQSFNVSDVNVVVTDYDWNSGVDLAEGQYLDITNSKLLFYKNEILTEVKDLSGYKLKAETITYTDTLKVMANVEANKKYVFSNPITKIIITACEKSFEETTIEFTTDSSGTLTFQDNSGITWVDGSAPSLNHSKSYLIVIFNKLGFVKEY